MALDDLARAQSSLARAVARTRAGEDYELAQKVRERGESVAKLLGGLLKLTRVHHADNDAFEAPVAELSRSAAELIALLGTVHLVAIEQQVYVNDLRVGGDAPGTKDLAAELATHNVGGMILHAPLAPDAVRSLVAAFAAKPAAAAPRRALQQALLDRGLRTVELTPRVRYVADRGGAAPSRDAGVALRRTLEAVEAAYDNVASGRVLNVLPLRRCVGELLDVGLTEPALWETVGEGLPHSSHATSVALVSLLVGSELALSASVLQDLGVAALVHDMGYACVPPDDVAQGLARHPIEGARVLLRQRGFHVAKLRRLKAVMDHHRDHADPRGQPSTFGAILRLAEDYTTALRLGAPRLAPPDVLGAMAGAAGRRYHPLLSQAMVNALGLYPPGTLLELDDGRRARSVSPARSAASFAAPIVRVYDPERRAFAAGRLDLARGGPGVRRAIPE